MARFRTAALFLAALVAVILPGCHQSRWHRGYAMPTTVAALVLA